MIESIKYATISNIYVKDLFFYQESKVKELISFCNLNGISLLPGADRKSIYKLVEESFIKVQLTENLICRPVDRLFDESTLYKFEDGDHDEVMFVVEEEVIKGVVHIVDYNNDFLNIEFYRASYNFERMLRDYLVSIGESNQSLLQWMYEKKDKSEHWNKRYSQCVPESIDKLEELEQKRKDLKPFQTFYLNDILLFTASKKLVSKKFKQNIEAIKQIRNWVAHSKDLAYKTKEIGKPLYKINELKTFVSNANKFFECYEELEFKKNQ